VKRQTNTLAYLQFVDSTLIGLKRKQLAFPGHFQLPGAGRKPASSAVDFFLLSY